MSIKNQAKIVGVYRLDNVEQSSSAISSAAGFDTILANSLLVVKQMNRQYAVMNSEELKASGDGHKVICYADTKRGSLNKLCGEHIKPLPTENIEEFLAGMVTALNLVEQGEAEGGQLSAVNSGNASGKPTEISESRNELTTEQVQSAIKQALKVVTNAMDKNIDNWVLEASKQLDGSVSQGGFGDEQRLRGLSSQLQDSSSELNKRFQARLIESLHKFNHPEKEQIELIAAQNLALTENDQWDKDSSILNLSAMIEGQAKLDFNQMNRRFCYLINKRVKPEKNIIGPEMMAWCICTAIDEISLGTEQVNALQKVVTDNFAEAMGKIYRDINLLWIGMDIIPQIKLRVWQDDYKPGGE